MGEECLGKPLPNNFQNEFVKELPSLEEMKLRFRKLTTNGKERMDTARQNLAKAAESGNVEALQSAIKEGEDAGLAHDELEVLKMTASQSRKSQCCNKSVADEFLGELEYRDDDIETVVEPHTAKCYHPSQLEKEDIESGYSVGLLTVP